MGVGSILLERSRVCSRDGCEIWKSIDSYELSGAPKHVAYAFGVPKERWYHILSDDSIDIHQSTQKFEKGCFWGALLTNEYVQLESGKPRIGNPLLGSVKQTIIQHARIRDPELISKWESGSRYARP